MKQSFLDALLAAKASRIPAGIVTELSSGLEALLVGDEPPRGNLPVEPERLLSIRAAIRKGNSGMVDGEWFLLARAPLLRLFIVGAVHITQILAPIARQASLEVTIIDPRRTFASPARFPHEVIHPAWPDEAFAELVPDGQTSIVTLTHDPKLDDPAIRAALQSDAFYIGALGSRRTHAARCERLRAAGWAEDSIARIHGPVGLPIGARSPGEIAISILAQLIQCHREAA